MVVGMAANPFGAHKARVDNLADLPIFIWNGVG
jgi:hypothetical protein